MSKLRVDSLESLTTGHEILIEDFEKQGFVVKTKDQLKQAITKLGANDGTIIITDVIYIDEDLTIPENVMLKFVKGGKLTVNTASTLTIKGGIDAGLYQIFDGNGAIDLSKAVKSVVTVDTIKELVLKTANIDGIGCNVNVLGYHEPEDGGGGYFYWDANEDKANHNGGTIIDPNIAFPTDWSNTTQQSTWFTAGTGTGCWKRVYSGAVNVKWFGAKGDGVTDNTTAIQNAIDSNKNIYFPNGDYLISGQIELPSFIAILGESQDTKLILGDSIYFYHKNFITIKNLTITSPNFSKTSRSYTPYKIYCNRSNNIYIDSVYFENINGTSVWAYNGDNINIKNCKFYNAGLYYIRMDTITGVLENNHLTSDVDFENDYYFYQMGTGSDIAYFNNFSENCAIGSSNTATNGTFGITYFLRGGKATLIKNHDSNPRWSNLLLGSNQYDSKVIGNHFNSINAHCFWIEVDGSSHHILSNNIFENGSFHAGTNGGDTIIITNNLFKNLPGRFDLTITNVKQIIFSNNIVEFASEITEAIYAYSCNSNNIKVSITNNQFSNAQKIVYANNYGGTGNIYNLLVTNNVISATSVLPEGLYHKGTTTLINCLDTNNLYIQITE